MSIEPVDNYSEMLKAAKELIQKEQYNALKAVNTALIFLYWKLGGIIVEKQTQNGWGDNILERLAKDLQTAYPGVRGFSGRNMRYIRSFYLTYKDNEKLQSLIAEVSWTHHLQILKCRDDQEREFYLRMTKRHGWSVRILEHQMDGKAYEGWLLNQTNFDKTLPDQHRNTGRANVKDDYNFDFLELAEPHLEKELGRELVSNISEFLSELGGYFTFVAQNFRLEVDELEYFIDLLFYNRQLQSLVAIELKIGDFKPEYGSKMNFYLSALNAAVKLPHENPSLGIIICKTKNRTTVEYTLQDINKPIAVATYNQYGTFKGLPERITKYLPTPEEIEKRLADLPE